MTLFQEVQAGRIPARLTVAGVYALQAAGIIGEDERFELVRGEIVPMAAAKSSVHERTKSQLIRALARAPGDVRLFVESTIQLRPDEYAEPDLAIWPTAIESEDVRPPDLLLVIEVAVSSLPYDLRERAVRYASVGVRDYWVVDAVRRTVRVHRDPMEQGFRTIAEFRADQPVSALVIPKLVVVLDQLD